MKEKNKQIIFYIGYIIFLVGVFINSTKYNFIPKALKISHIIQIVGILIVIFKIILDVYDIFKHSKNVKVDYKKILFFLISCIVVYFSKAKIVAYLAVLLLGCKDIKMEKLLKVTLYTCIAMLIFTVCSYFLGFITEIQLERYGKIRHSFGWTSSNQLMIVLFEIICIYLYLRNKKIRFYDFIICLLIILVGYYFTNSRMSVLCSVLLIALLILLRYTKISKLLDKFKYFNYCLPIILATFIISLTFAYEPYHLYKLDTFFTGRLYFGSEAIKTYKIKPFGSEIKYYGQRAEGELVDKAYNYIDSSYLKILVNYGYIYFITIIVALILLTKYAYDKKNYYLLCAIIVIEIYGTIDSFLLCVEMNPFLLYLCSTLYPLSKRK